MALPKDPKDRDESSDWMRNWDGCVLELTQCVTHAFRGPAPFITRSRICTCQCIAFVCSTATMALRRTMTSLTTTATLTLAALVCIHKCCGLPLARGTHTDDLLDHPCTGHIGFLVPDVYEISAKLEKAGVEFQKKPDDGTMKGLAFAKDPDGYW